MNDLVSKVGDIALGSLLREVDLVLILHDAKIIDKDVVAKRWRDTADRADLELSDSVREFLRISATGLEAARSQN